jgi:hypothetical protein
MGFKCPIMKLPAVTTADDVLLFDTERLYFYANDTLDYFDYFLDQGEHTPNAAETVVDLEMANCKWEVEGRQYSWPMLRSDCVLGYSAIEKRATAQNLGTGLDGLKGAIRNYHENGSKSTKAEALIYALNVLSGDGTSANAGPTITGCAFPAGGTSKFGAYYGQ